MPEERDAGEQDAFWRNILTHDGVFAVDSRQNIVHWSEGAQRILGYRPEEALGRPCYEVVGGRDTRNLRFCRRNCPVLVNALRGRPTPDYDIVCLTPSGEERWLNISLALLRSNGRGNGHALRVVHIFRDVTRRRYMEEFARKASAALRHLVQGRKINGADEPEASPVPVPRLSPRELDILRLLAAGLSTQQIAEAILVSPITARNYVNRLLTKLGVENRLQAVVYASQQRLI